MRRSAAVLSAMLAVLFTGACSTTVTGSPTASAASAADATSATDAAPATASPDTATAGSDAGSAGGSDAAGGAGAPGSGSFCDAALADVNLGKSLLGAMTGTGDLNAVIAQIRAANDTVVAAAPAEIHADAVTVYQLSDKELDLIASLGGNPTAFVQDPTFRQDVRQALPASMRFDDYLKSHCGIDVEKLSGLGD